MFSLPLRAHEHLRRFKRPDRPCANRRAVPRPPLAGVAFGQVLRSRDLQAQGWGAGGATPCPRGGGGLGCPIPGTKDRGLRGHLGLPRKRAAPRHIATTFLLGGAGVTPPSCPRGQAPSRGLHPALPPQ